jgi:uncharacterized protein YjdB
MNRRPRLPKVTAIVLSVFLGSCNEQIGPAKVASVEISFPNGAAAAVSTTLTATATLRSASNSIIEGRPVTWTSSLPSVATIDAATGLMTAISVGQTNITASSEGVSGSAPFSVIPRAVAKVEVLLPNASVAVSSTFTATANVLDASNVPLSGKTVNWTSATPSVATIDAMTGLVTAVSAGQTLLTATSDGISGSAALVVTAPSVASVEVSLPSASLAISSTFTATAIVKSASNAPITGKTVSWASSSPSIATIDASTGLVTAVAVGQTNITATSDGISGSAPLTVTATTPPVTMLFQDSFESGNLSFSQNGISWISNAFVDVSSSIARTGSSAARFRQGLSVNWSELRFGGLPNLTEAFIQFYLYYPSGNESPSVGPRVVVTGTSNDKFFRLWGNQNSDYAVNPGNKVGASIWGDGSGSDGKLGIEYEFSPINPPQFGMGEGLNPIPRVTFLNDTRRGKWVQIRIRAKVATAANNDGAIQIWADGVLILTHTSLHTWPYGTGPNTYTHGYLLGFANNPYTAGQFTYIDDVTISSGGFPP